MWRLKMDIVILPRLDPGMKEGTLLEWYKKEGDKIEKGDKLAKIEGEKVVFDVEAKNSGILKKILLEEKIPVNVGSPIALILKEGEQIPESEVEKIRSQIEYVSKIEETELIISEEISQPMTSSSIRASPLARRIAEEHNISLEQITGVEGTIRKEDVLQFIEQSEKSQISIELEIEETRNLSGMRKTIADRMTQSYKEIPQLAIVKDIDISNLLSYKEKIEKITNEKISMYSLFAKITAKALEKHKILNSSAEKDQIKIFKNINIGIAVTVEEGLIVPVVPEANKRSILELNKIIKKLIEDTQSREIEIDQLRNGTFTITNLGGFGIDYFLPIINPPQAAILGVGKIDEKVQFIKEKIITIPIIKFALVFDHRVIDGAKGALFLNEIEKIIKEPLYLFV
jgi:pyruvate dehydrogenase E2 component (dihydrolipoamide acetyltransferase)